MLSFVDQPADLCIANPDGTPSEAYIIESIALGNNYCGSTLLGSPLLAYNPQLFSTELVGVTNSYVPGSPCNPVTCVDLGGFTWDDNFNGFADVPGTGTGGTTPGSQLPNEIFL
jgi:hypothetical protein